MKLTTWDFIRKQLKSVGPALVADLTGKTVLITGANTGLGYEAAKYFAKMNAAKVIIACRSREKGEEAVKRMKTETGLDNIQLRLLDLAKFSSVIEFANKFEEEEERLDIFVANAAVAKTDYTTTEDGWETSLQVNNLSTLLLNIRLLPTMLKTAQRFSTEPRLVVVGSGTHYWTKFESRLLDSSEPLKMFSSEEYTKSTIDNRYPDTKLLDLFMTRALAKVLENTPVVADVVCPGYCYSELRRDMKWTDRIVFAVMDVLIGRSSDEGARQYIWAALADNTEGRMRGAYVDSMNIQETSDYSLSKEGLAAEDILWKEMIKVLSEVDSNVPRILEECSSFRS